VSNHTPAPSHVVESVTGKPVCGRTRTERLSTVTRCAASRVGETNRDGQTPASSQPRQIYSAHYANLREPLPKPAVTSGVALLHHMEYSGRKVLPAFGLALPLLSLPTFLHSIWTSVRPITRFLLSSVGSLFLPLIFLGTASA
jgi:hypothetical protein